MVFLSKWFFLGKFSHFSTDFSSPPLLFFNPSIFLLQSCSHRRRHHHHYLHLSPNFSPELTLLCYCQPVYVRTHPSYMLDLNFALELTLNVLLLLILFLTNSYAYVLHTRKCTCTMAAEGRFYAREHNKLGRVSQRSSQFFWSLSVDHDDDACRLTAHVRMYVRTYAKSERTYVACMHAENHKLCQRRQLRNPHYLLVLTLD